MKKTALVLLFLLLLTGCGKKDAIIGKWQTNYQIKGIGNITESYEFKEKGKCIRTLKTPSIINTDCTYEFNKDKTKIKITWKDKLYKDNYDEYKEVNANSIKIGTHTFSKVKEAKK